MSADKIGARATEQHEKVELRLKSDDRVHPGKRHGEHRGYDGGENDRRHETQPAAQPDNDHKESEDMQRRIDDRLTDRTPVAAGKQ